MVLVPGSGDTSVFLNDLSSQDLGVIQVLTAVAGSPPVGLTGSGRFGLLAAGTIAAFIRGVFVVYLLFSDLRVALYEVKLIGCPLISLELIFLLGQVIGVFNCFPHFQVESPHKVLQIIVLGAVLIIGKEE